MGLIGNVISFARRITANGCKYSEAKIDVGGGDIRTSEDYGPAGDDSFPLDTDKAIAVEVPRTGGIAIVGYLDTLDSTISEPGEKRIYSRDATSGLVVAEIYLKADGSINCSNDNGSFKLEANGNFVVNKLTIDINGNITTSGDVTAGTISLKTHVHPAGTPPGPTGVPIP